MVLRTEGNVYLTLKNFLRHCRSSNTSREEKSWAGAAASEWIEGGAGSLRMENTLAGNNLYEHMCALLAGGFENRRKRRRRAGLELQLQAGSKVESCEKFDG